MNRFIRTFCCALTALTATVVSATAPALATTTAAKAPTAKELTVSDLTPTQMLAHARTMFPRETFDIEGTLETAEQRGLNATERPYKLTLNWSAGTPSADCQLFAKEGDTEPIQHALLSRPKNKPTLTLIAPDGTRTENVPLSLPVGESDLTWTDLAFDYLWWPDVRRLSEADIEAAHLSTRVSGRNCILLLATSPASEPGLSAIRIWIDRSTGALLQTQQLDGEGRPTRLLWVQRVGREEGRWVPRLFRIRRAGMRRETSLYVDSIRSAHFSTGKDR